MKLALSEYYDIDSFGLTCITIISVRFHAIYRTKHSPVKGFNILKRLSHK